MNFIGGGDTGHGGPTGMLPPQACNNLKCTLANAGSHLPGLFLNLGMKKYRLDKTVFKMQTFEEAERNNIFEESTPLYERLNQGWYLSAMVHGIDPYKPVKMVKRLVSIRKHLK